MENIQKMQRSRNLKVDLSWNLFTLVTCHVNVKVFTGQVRIIPNDSYNNVFLL